LFRPLFVTVNHFIFIIQAIFAFAAFILLYPGDPLDPSGISTYSIEPVPILVFPIITGCNSVGCNIRFNDSRIPTPTPREKPELKNGTCKD
jgi:hypothetical protein